MLTSNGVLTLAGIDLSTESSDEDSDSDSDEEEDSDSEDSESSFTSFLRFFVYTDKATTFGVEIVRAFG